MASAPGAAVDVIDVDAGMPRSKRHGETACRRSLRGDPADGDLLCHYQLDRERLGAALGGRGAAAQAVARRTEIR